MPTGALVANLFLPGAQHFKIGIFPTKLAPDWPHQNPGALKSPETGRPPSHAQSCPASPARYTFPPGGDAETKSRINIGSNLMNVLSTSETISGVQRADKPRTVGEAIRRHAEARPKQARWWRRTLRPLSYQALQDEIDSHAIRPARGRPDARCAHRGRDREQRAGGARDHRGHVLGGGGPIDPKLTVAEVERCLLILRPDAVLVLNQAESAARTAADSADFPSSRRPSRPA
jgi:hypothetical protein